MKTESAKTDISLQVYKYRATKFCTVVPHICGSPASNLPYIILVALEVWNIFGPLAYVIFGNKKNIPIFASDDKQNGC